MKYRIIHLIFTLFAVAFVSCRSDLDSLNDGNRRHIKDAEKIEAGKFYTMKLSLGGDYITELEEPLRGADNETENGVTERDTFIGINVYMQKKGTNDTKEQYAYGLFKFSPNEETHKFDKNTTIEIKLYSDYIYSFDATVLTEWSDYLAENTGGSKKGYTYPFRLKPKSSYEGNGSQYDVDKLNDIKYTFNIQDYKGELVSDNQRYYFPYLKSGIAFVDLREEWKQSTGTFHYPRVKRYYGELNDYDPETTSTNVATIPMAYQCFGIKIVVESLPKNTTLTVQDKEYSETKNEQDFLLFPKDHVFSGVSTWEGLYSMKDLQTLEEQQLSPNSKTFNLSFTWDKGGGVKETFESGDIEVRAKTRKIIKVNVQGQANEESRGNIKFDFTQADETLVDDEEIVTVNNKPS